MKQCAKSEVCNVLELIESFEDDEHFYIVTKFMEGGSLLDHILETHNDTRDEALLRTITY